jgi:hypothetical protein
VIKKPRERGGHSPRWAAEPEKINNNNNNNAVVTKITRPKYMYLENIKLYFPQSIEMITFTTSCVIWAYK